MNWKLKCLALHALAHAPGSAAVHRFLQRRVTGRYLDEITDEVFDVYGYHARNFLKLRDSGRAAALEFGAGRSLVSALLLSAAGAREVYAYDIERLATAEQINHVIRQLRARRVPHANPDWPEVGAIEADLRRHYRIHYRAPGDARRTGLPDNSIDFIFSTSTLEHIPCADITAILTECRRIATRSALLSFIVDYHDHYASADPAINRFNFYRYDDAAWAWFNPSNHHQNRLRHSDYESLFASAGWGALENRPIVPEDSEELLNGTPLAAAFTHYSRRDLAALNGFFLLEGARTIRERGVPE